MARMARAACDEAGVQQLSSSPPIPSAPTPPCLGDDARDASMRGQPRGVRAAPQRPNDTAVILYTSGTTGRPKGAELTHENMLLNAVATHDMIRPACKSGFEQDVALVTLPLFHSTAQTCQMNSGLYGGLRLVLMPRFDPAQVLQTSSTSRSGSGLACRRCTGRCCEHVHSSSAESRRRSRSVCASASPGARRCRSTCCSVSRKLRGASARRLRTVRNGAGGRLQSAVSSDQAGNRRVSDFRRRRALCGRRGQACCRQASAARSSFADRM